MRHTTTGPVLVLSMLALLAPGPEAESTRQEGRWSPVTATLAESEERRSAARIGGGLRVRDITLRVDPRRRGPGAWSDTWGDSLVFDKNRDGNPDVLLSFHHTAGWEIWLGREREGFTHDRSLRVLDRHQCATADFAGPSGRRPDGRPDLYCVRGANNGTVSDKENELLVQGRRGGFTNVIDDWGARDPSGRGRAVSILYPRPGARPSLFVGNAEPELHPSRDHIFVNRGRRFVERRTGGLPSVQGTRCSATGDFDRDGRQDFLSCSFSLRLYENRTRSGPVRYREVARAEGLPEGRFRDAGMVRLNRDRWPDLVTVTRAGLEVRLNRRATPHFPEVDFVRPLVAGHTFCAGHADGDGDVDLLVVQQLESVSDDRQRRDWMLLNAGRGQGFAPLPVPQPPSRDGRNGNGDTCTAIPGYRGERAAWTISNGRQDGPPEQLRPGYRQLVIVTRR